MSFRCIMSLSYRVTFLCTVFVQIHYTSESHVRFLFYEKVVKWCIINTLVSFMIPIAYLILIIPLEYALELYSKYELLFLRMTFKEEKDKKTKIRHRVAIICSCRIYVRRVLLFQREYMGMMYVKMKDNEFEKLIREFRNACKRLTY